MIPLSAFFGFLSGLLVLKYAAVIESLGLFAACRLLVLISILPALSLAVSRSRDCWNRRNCVMDRHRVHLKVLAITVCWAATLIYSGLMAGMGISPFFEFAFDFLLASPLLLILLAVYVSWADQRQKQPEDDYFRFGQLLTGERSWSWVESKAFFMSWAVKVLFIPAMYGWLVQSVSQLLLMDFSLSPALVGWLFFFGLSFDLVIATSGYIFATPFLGTEIRSTDDTWSGWLVCMICYPPLVGIFHVIRQQVDQIVWSDWLSMTDPMYWIWAFLVTLSWLVYWISTASFGLRFSNLTYRGLVSHGPYRFSKHPAYIAKNIYWWLHTVPFVGVSTLGELGRNLVGLIFVSAIYYMRAKTEERHLLRYPEYGAYSRWIEEHGLIAILKRWIGFNGRPLAEKSP